MDIHQRLKDNIETLRKARGIDSIAKLAKIAKVAPNTIHNSTKLRYSISLSSLAKVARALGVDPHVLLAPTPTIDPATSDDAGQVMDNYRLADAEGRDTIRKVAAAQALSAAHGSTRQVDPSAD